MKRAAFFGARFSLMLSSNKRIVWMLSSRSLILPRIVLAIMAPAFLVSSLSAQTQRTPSDTVRAFYKAMHDHRFKEAWALTIYRPAVEGLNAEEMEDLRPDFEEKAAAIPDQVEIAGETISGDIATVFVKVPVSESTPQNVSQPVNLIKSGGGWIIGTEADQVEVKK